VRDDAVTLSYRTKNYWDDDRQDIEQHIGLESTPCHFGGQRRWFLCRAFRNGRYCGRRVAKLYLGGGRYFACRHCYYLAYGSQHEALPQRGILMAGPLSYTSLNQMLDSSFPKLAFNYWKSCFLGDLSDDIIAVLREQFVRCPSPMSKLILEHFHGAALRPNPTDTAFPHRDPGYSVLIIAQWSDPKDNTQNIAWAKETFAALKPFTRHGAYSNYLADDEPLSGVKRAFAENFPRLQKLKDLYDPGNLFRNNQNIPPSKEN
jgi:hypothetical protein